jgi:hypothetical protein
MNTLLTAQETIDLKRLISQADCEDNTANIRTLKHSPRIRADMEVLVKYLADAGSAATDDEAREVAPFLATHYGDIFKRIVKHEIDLGIMHQVLLVLEAIESGTLDQHQGSVVVGKLLKELYLDSAVRHGQHLDEAYAQEQVPKEEGKSVSWSTYKKQKLTKQD